MIFLSAVGRVISTYLRRSFLALHSSFIVATVVCFPVVTRILELNTLFVDESLIFKVRQDPGVRQEIGAYDGLLNYRLL